MTMSTPPKTSDDKMTGGNVTALPSAERREELRVLEAVLFAAREPLSTAQLAAFLEGGDDAEALLLELQAHYAGRGVHLRRIGDKWAFRTAEDLSWLLQQHRKETRKLSQAALETLAIIAYHQPVTRAEIEAIRGVAVSKGTLDTLLQTRWVKMRGRKRVPGRPMTYGTTDAFLDHFALTSLADLPGARELKEAGLLDQRLPPDFKLPDPARAKDHDLDPLDDDDIVT